MRRYLPLLLFIGFTYWSCAPTVRYTSYDNSYEPKSFDSPIDVFQLNDNLPFGKYKVIGQVQTGDTGFSLGCGYQDILRIVINKGRQAGGDAIQITRVRTPGGGSTCYKVTANILAIKPAIINNNVLENIEKEINSSNALITKQMDKITTAPDVPTFIAVVDFKGNNISDGDCRALTDRLRAELFNTKYFKVIEREMMEQIIEEQGFQQSGCSTDECMVEVGKLIGVEKIVGGSISQVGNVFSVSARIVNVETGEIETTGIYDHIGNIGELLTGGMKKVAYELIK